MPTYLFGWNPLRWEWHDLASCQEKIRESGWHEDTWSTGVTKKIHPGDRVFIIRLGSEPRGIFASGWSSTNVYPDLHWDDTKAARGENALYVGINLNVLLNPDKEEILSLAVLNLAPLSSMHWSIQASGVQIPDHIASILEEKWAAFLYKRTSEGKEEGLELVSQLEGIETALTFYEGSKKRITVNAYERNSHAREICIQYYGHKCQVCGFDFEQVYGEIGKGYIQVHHLIPLAQIGGEYEVNAKEDLRPVCANCHAMIHRRTPPYLIGELGGILAKRGYPR